MHRFGSRLPVETEVTLLGRDPGADVRFYDEYPTVSRRHAIIRCSGGQFILEPLSQTNSTLVNGHHVTAPVYLHNGDEIRLSTDGPRLAIIFPGKDDYRNAGAPAPAILPRPRSNPLDPRSQRLIPPAGVPAGGTGNPRRYFFAVIALLVVAALGLGIWKIIDLASANRRLGDLVAHSLEQQQQQSNSAETPGSGNTAGYPERAQDLPVDPSPVSTSDWPTFSGGGGGSIGGAASADAMKVADKSVYFVMSLGFEVTTPDGDHYEIECGNNEGEIPGWSGTGFLLSDGRFVTARHVVEPWYYLDGADGADPELLSLNLIASNGGKVVAYLGAVSPTGDKILFKSSECRANRSGDQVRRTSSGERVTIAPIGSGDFATFRAGRKGGLPFSPEASRSLSRGTKLTVLSFPLGLGANSYNDINPVYGTATVAADGLQEGMILTTETTYEKGSSGGPVFITDPSGRLVVVGITSAIAGRSTGFIEPISSIR